MRRRRVLAGNWKMHKGPGEARAFLEAFLEVWEGGGDERIVLFPPVVSLPAAREAVRRGGAAIDLGVQNIHWEEEGAFTGETSARMAVEAGAGVALVGHSERRHLFGETIEETVRKARAALGAGLEVVLCVGETLAEREAGRAEEVVAAQLDPVLGLGEVAGGLDRLAVAYEPVWAIGTGRTATPGDAGTMHQAIRRQLAGTGAGSEAVPILYGGSVKPDNADALLGEEGVDGVLVGGASLDPGSFARICRAA